MPAKGTDIPNLYRLRRARGFTSAAALARAAQRSVTTIQSLETGKRGASADTVWRLARALRVSRATLLGGE